MSLLGKMVFIGMHGKVTITLSGQEHTVISSTDPTAAELKWDQNGNVYTRDNVEAYVQIDTATDWIRPTDDAPSDYQIRYTNLDTSGLGSGTATYTAEGGSAVEDTWYDLSVADMLISVSDAIDGPASAPSISFDVQIRKGTGTTLATGSYVLTANLDSA
jgi:hypothetical protein